jgi:hypothetical protein
MYGYGTVALPTGATMNPASRETATYYDADQTAYVLQNRDGKYRVFTSFGSFNWNLNDRKDFVHDQTGRDLGTWLVVGIITPTSTDGQIPNRKISHWVAK